MKILPEIHSLIEQHAEYIIQEYYLKPYKSQQAQNGINRPYHGAQHVSRAAILVNVMANLYRKYGYHEALKLTPEDLKILQIAALFHDSAREGDGKDFWDLPSAENCYHYLIKSGTTHEKAKWAAEAIANKDYGLDGKGKFKKYYELTAIKENETGKINWKEIEDNRQSSIAQLLVGDADCLDIIRARDVFDEQYLNFYQKIVKKDNKEALKDMNNIIHEVRTLIIHQGDKWHHINYKIKNQYEGKDCYQKTSKDLDEQQIYTLYLRCYYANNQLLEGSELGKPLKNSEQETLEQMLKAFQEFEKIYKEVLEDFDKNNNQSKYQELYNTVCRQIKGQRKKKIVVAICVALVTVGVMYALSFTSIAAIAVAACVNYLGVVGAAATVVVASAVIVAAMAYLSTIFIDDGKPLTQKETFMELLTFAKAEKGSSELDYKVLSDFYDGLLANKELGECNFTIKQLLDITNNLNSKLQSEFLSRQKA